MEYIYAAMLLHKAGKKIEEGSVKKVLEAAEVKIDESRVKALVASLDGVNIDEAIQKSQAVQVAATPATETKQESKESEKKAEKQEEKVSEEEASAGLGALFG
jgi:large subunit ribosomal protein L12